MPESEVDRFPRIVFGAGGTSKVATFCGLTGISLLVLVHKAYHFISRLMTECLRPMASNGNFRVSGGTGLLFGPSQSSLFLLNNYISNIVFPSLGPIGRPLLSIFLDCHLGEHPFGPRQRFGCWFLWEQHSWWKYQRGGSLCLQGVKAEMPRP